MGMQHVAQQIEIDNRARAEAEIWGHLAPAPRQTYHGTILFAHGEYGDIVPLRTKFKRLPDSPWFFRDMIEFIASRRTKAGKLYSFTGHYLKFKNGNYRFSGKVRVAKIAA